jgi:hypothetical protein
MIGSPLRSGDAVAAMVDHLGHHAEIINLKASPTASTTAEGGRHLNLAAQISTGANWLNFDRR